MKLKRYTKIGCRRFVNALKIITLLRIFKVKDSIFKTK